MIQTINPHPAPGCNRSPPYYMHFQKTQFLGVFRPFLQRSLPKLTEELSMVSLSFLAAASNKLKYSSTNSFLYSLVAPKSRRPNWKKKYWIIHCIAYHYLCRCCFELEIRVIIKIESHLWYPINIWLIWMEMKEKKWDLELVDSKNGIFSNLNVFLPKF